MNESTENPAVNGPQSSHYIMTYCGEEGSSILFVMDGSRTSHFH